MRKAFERQQRLDTPAIGNVTVNLKGRSRITPILRALQHIYRRPSLRDAILALIAGNVNGKTRADRGRPGLSHWEILVLAAARLGCNYTYDELQNLAEEHRALRQIMGIGEWQGRAEDEGEKPQSEERFNWRRIEGNLTLLSPQTLEKINQAIIGEGHRLEPKAAETVRADSFVVETNIHYPTDSSLIPDGLRKVHCLAAKKLVRKIRGMTIRSG